MKMNRRDFVKKLGTAALGGIVVHEAKKTGPLYADTLNPRHYEGVDMTDWIVTLGDGLWTGPGQDPISSNDIGTDHNATHSELQANILMRGVMVHNITFNRFIDIDAFNFVHTAQTQFRLPQVPTPGGSLNAQTLEVGLFIWDGGNTRLDYGFAFQWILNPWMSTFGDIRVWSANNGGEWVNSGYLAPDTNWHDAKLVLDHQNSTTSLLIDNAPFMSLFGGTPKPANWGTETAARFQVEIISLWPGSNPVAPMHRAEFRNWTWDWTPNTGQ